MNSSDVTWLHLPDGAPEPLTPKERDDIETLIRLDRTAHPTASRFAAVVQHALAACLELVTWDRGRSQRDYIKLPPGDPRPLSPILRERLEGMLWVTRIMQGSSLAEHIQAMLEESARVSAMIEPSPAEDREEGKVLDFDRAVQKRRHPPKETD